MELWKDIEGYEGYYQISNFGNIKNVQMNYIKVLSDVNSAGYLRVTLYKPIKKRFFVHRLVASAFCLGKQEGYIVNHIDGNKQNNSSENLEWVTRSQNDKHAYQLGLRHLVGGAQIQQDKAKRKVILTDINTQEILTFNGYKDCAKYFQLNPVYVQHCCKDGNLIKGIYKAQYEKMV